MKTIIENYEDANIELAKAFIKKFYKDVYNEKADDRDIEEAMYMFTSTHSKHGFGMININDCYFDINDVYIAMKNDMNLKVLENFYNDSLEAHYTNKPLGVNLYNYWRRSKLSKEEIEEEIKQDLEKSKENIKFAKDELEKSILEFNIRK